MAEALVRSVTDKFADLVIDKAKLLSGVHKEVANIKDELESIQCFLQDADAKAEVNNGVTVWVKQVKVIADQIEEVIDDYNLHLDTPHDQQCGFINLLCKLCRTVTQLGWRHKIASKIREINTSLHEIKERAERYSFRVIVLANQSLYPEIDLVNIDTIPTQPSSSTLSSLLPSSPPPASILPGSETEFSRVFKKLDRNGDGKITANELKDLFMNKGISISDTELTEMIEKVDVNGDGHVDIDEFAALYESIMDELNKEEYLREAFDVFDQNGDGFITAEELRSVLVSLGHTQGWTVDDCKRMIARVDVDGNEMVSFSEFKQMMRGGAFDVSG